MCEKLNELKDVGSEGFWDTTGTVSSGKYNSEEYVFHEEPAEGCVPNGAKVCILEVAQNSPILGDTCFKCANNIFLRKKANLKKR